MAMGDITMVKTQVSYHVHWQTLGASGLLPSQGFAHSPSLGFACLDEEHS